MKVTAHGEVFVSVNVISSDADICVLGFNVRDTGIGIAEDKVEGLFKSFSQIDSSSTRKYGGTGLGLAISQKLVALMGGVIRVTSTQGKGTNFNFSIKATISKNFSPNQMTTNVEAASFASVPTTPVKHEVLMQHIGKSIRNADKEIMIATPGKQILPIEFAHTNPLSILVVEDNPVNQKLAVRILEKMGYRPDIVGNGLLAVDALQLKSYNLILMDVQMPEMDGLEATRQIRMGSWIQPTIIAMTANAMPGDREECLAAGMDDYISKPVKLETFIGLLEKWGSRTSTSFTNK